MKYSNASLPPMSFLVSRTVTLRVPFNEAAERVCEGVGETYGPAERERKKRFLVLSQGKRGLLFKAISFPPKEALFSVCLFPCAFNANPISVLWTKFRSCPGKKKKLFFPSHVPCRWKLPLARRDLCLKERG